MNSNSNSNRKSNGVNRIKVSRSQRGFSLVEGAVVLAISIIVIAVVVMMGWGTAFAFSSHVLIPWLGVPAAWINLATLAASIALTGVGAVFILFVLAVIAAIVLACLKNR